MAKKLAIKEIKHLVDRAKPTNKNNPEGYDSKKLVLSYIEKEQQQTISFNFNRNTWLFKEGESKKNVALKSVLKPSKDLKWPENIKIEEMPTDWIDVLGEEFDSGSFNLKNLSELLLEKKLIKLPPAKEIVIESSRKTKIEQQLDGKIKKTRAEKKAEKKLAQTKQDIKEDLSVIIEPKKSEQHKKLVIEYLKDNQRKKLVFDPSTQVFYHKAQSLLDAEGKPLTKADPSKQITLTALLNLDPDTRRNTTNCPGKYGNEKAQAWLSSSVTLPSEVIMPSGEKLPADIRVKEFPPGWDKVLGKDFNPAGLSPQALAQMLVDKKLAKLPEPKVQVAKEPKLKADKKPRNKKEKVVRVRTPEEQEAFETRKAENKARRAERKAEKELKGPVDFAYVAPDEKAITSFDLQFDDREKKSILNDLGESELITYTALTLYFFDTKNEIVCATQLYASHGFVAFGFVDARKQTLKVASYERKNNPKDAKGDKNEAGENVAGDNQTKGLWTHYPQIAYIEKLDKGVAGGASCVYQLQGLKFSAMHELPDAISRHPILPVRVSKTKEVDDEIDDGQERLTGEALEEYLLIEQKDMLFSAMPSKRFKFEGRGTLLNEEEVREKYIGSSIVSFMKPVGFLKGTPDEPKEIVDRQIIAKEALGIFLDNSVNKDNIEEALHVELSQQGEILQCMKNFALSRITPQKETIQTTMEWLIEAEALTRDYFIPPKKETSTDPAREVLEVA